DSVIFSDGEFQGPDASGTFAAMNAAGDTLLALVTELQKMSGPLDKSTVDALIKDRTTPRSIMNMELLRRGMELRMTLVTSPNVTDQASFQKALARLHDRYSSELKIWKAPA